MINLNQLKESLSFLMYIQKDQTHQLNKSFIYLQEIQLTYDKSISQKQNPLFLKLRVELIYNIITFLDFQSILAMRLFSSRFNQMFLTMIPNLISQFESHLIRIENDLKIYQIQDNFDNYLEFWNEYQEINNYFLNIPYIKLQEIFQLFRQKIPAKTIQKLFELIKCLIQKHINEKNIKSDAKWLQNQILNLPKLLFNYPIQDITNDTLSQLIELANINELDITLSSFTANQLLRFIKALINLRQSINFNQMFAFVIIKRKQRNLQLETTKLHLLKIRK